jgi:hypothetical protein
VGLRDFRDVDVEHPAEPGDEDPLLFDIDVNGRL